MTDAPKPPLPQRLSEKLRQKQQIQVQTRFAELIPTSYSAGDRSAEATLSVGAAVRRPFGMEVLDISPTSISMDRVRAGGIPVLDSHNAQGIGSMLGRINEVWLEGKSLVGRIRFNETPEGQKAEGMVSRGEIKHLSIGYRVDDWAITDQEGRDINPEYVRYDDDSLTYTAKRWELLEASLVSVPADHQAQFRSAEAPRSVNAPSEEEGTVSGLKKASGPSSTSRKKAMSEFERDLPRGEMAPLNDKATGNDEPASTTNKKTKVDAESDNTAYKGGKAQARKKDDDEDDWEKQWSEDEKRKRKARASGADDSDEEDDADTKRGKRNTFDDEDETDDSKKRKARAKDEDMDCPPVRSARGSRAVAAELARIGDQFRPMGVDLDVSDAIVRGISPDSLRKFAIDELSKMQSRNQPRNTGVPRLGPHVEVLRDEREGRAEAMELAMTRRIYEVGGYLNAQGERQRGYNPSYSPNQDAEKAFAKRYGAQADQYRGHGWVDLAAECIGWTPKSTRFIRNYDAFDILTRAFNTTSDFPNIFQNVLNKSLLARYELHMPTYRELSVERPFNDFRPHPQIRAGEFPTLQQVQETGELKYGSTADTGENVSVVPYGVIFSVSRTMLVNDDIGAIDQMLGSAGDAVLVFENTTWFNMLLSGSGNNGPTLLQDGTQVFTAGHGNLASPGAAPSIATIATARQSLRQMKSIQGLFLNVPPRIILTGPIQETNADQMVTNITPTLTTSVNPFSGRLRSVSDANITDDSWYLFGEPTRLPSFVHGFLRGAGGPRVRTFEPFGVQGIKISLEHDFAAGAIDYRSVYRSPAF